MRNFDHTLLVFLAAATLLLSGAIVFRTGPAPSLTETPPASLLDPLEQKTDRCLQAGRRLHALSESIPARDEDLDSLISAVEFAHRNLCSAKKRKSLLPLRLRVKAECDTRLIHDSATPYRERSRCLAAVMDYRRKALGSLIDPRRAAGEESTERLEWRLEVLASPAALAEAVRELLARDPENERARTLGRRLSP